MYSHLQFRFQFPSFRILTYLAFFCRIFQLISGSRFRSIYFVLIFGHTKSQLFSWLVGAVQDVDSPGSTASALDGYGLSFLRDQIREEKNNTKYHVG